VPRSGRGLARADATRIGGRGIAAGQRPRLAPPGGSADAVASSVAHDLDVAVAIGAVNRQAGDCPACLERLEGRMAVLVVNAR